MQSELLLRAREMIGELTPLLSDCGTLCGAACCRPDEDGQGGVYLFPGEEALPGGYPWGRVDRDAFGPMLVCDGMCDRDRRPLACRIFPLTPVRGKDGQWTVRIDVRARAMCPLARHGVRGLNPEFARAVRSAIRLLAADAEGEAFLRRWEALEAEYRFEL